MADTIHLPQGYRLAAFDVLDSTNGEAARAAAAGEGHGLFVWAKEQTAGRGRRNRSWVSKPGNLFVSVLLRPECALAQAAQISFGSALAVRDALVELGMDVRDIGLKWPNDVLVRGSKISGILLESQITDGHPLVIVGAGVNLQHHPSDVMYPTTDLMTLGRRVTPAEALTAFARHFALWYDRWHIEGFGPVRDAWMASAAGLWQTISVRTEKTEKTGIHEGLSPEGALLLRRPDNVVEHIAAGDVFFGKEGR